MFTAPLKTVYIKEIKYVFIELWSVNFVEQADRSPGETIAFVLFEATLYAINDCIMYM